MYVKAIIILFVIAGIAIIFLLSRSNTNRSGIRDDKANLDNIRSGVGATRDSVDRIESGIEDLSVNNRSAIKRTEDIKQHNTSARKGIDKALGILEQAKNRNNT